MINLLEKDNLNIETDHFGHLALYQNDEYLGLLTLDFSFFHPATYMQSLYESGSNILQLTEIEKEYLRLKIS